MPQNAKQHLSSASASPSAHRQPTPQDRKRRSRVGPENDTSTASAPTPKRLKSSDAETPHTTTLSRHAHAPFRPSDKNTNSGTAMLGVQGSSHNHGAGGRHTTGRPTVRKLVIKNKRTGGDEAREAKINEYFDATRNEVGSALDCILSDKPTLVPLDRIYRGVEDLCRQGSEQRLYQKVTDVCREYLVQVVRPQLSRGEGDIGVLANVFVHWKKWNEKSRLIRSIFSYLDRTYLLKRRDCLVLNDMLIVEFRRLVHGTQTPEGRSVSTVIVDGICTLVAYDREDDRRFQQQLLRDGVAMLYVFGTYFKWFERRFVDTSCQYFREVAAGRAAGLGLADYVRECRQLLDREKFRCDAYNIDSTTKGMLVDGVYDAFIREQTDKLLDKTSLSRLMAACDIDSLGSLYHLLSQAGIVDQLRVPWRSHIRSAGSEIVQDTSRGDEMVTRLLELRRSLGDILQGAFGGDEDFEWALREAFTEFMNDRENARGFDSGAAKIGEMIAKYIDMLLRGGLKALPRALYTDAKDREMVDGRGAAPKAGSTGVADEDGELDRQLDSAVGIFRFVEGKAAFEAFYKRDLARRLLMDRSSSQDAERTMLSKLREECGSTFTHNLEQMFKDKALAADEMRAYKEARVAAASEDNDGSKSPLDLQVMVLSSAAWPAYDDVGVTLPPEVASEIERFDTHYKKKHSGRVLKWKHGLAHCVVKARFQRGPKELLVSLLQAAVLVLFNDMPDDRPLSYQQISRATGLSGGDLDRTLQSLACGKARVLTKHPRGRDVADKDTFTFNAGFWDARYKVKINQIQMKETKAENKATHEKIVKDRKMETQAAIVRIMKSRKTMTHALLVAEVIDMTKNRGPVDAAMIKKEIESLIDKDYLERDDNGAYQYLA